MSAEECITAGWLQNKYPNVCKYAEEGYFGSKFVTVVVSGDDQSQIHFSGYQVSNQCSALVEDDWLIPVQNAPELAYVRDDKPCVPDVKYMVSIGVTLYKSCSVLLMADITLDIHGEWCLWVAALAPRSGFWSSLALNLAVLAYKAIFC